MSEEVITHTKETEYPIGSPFWLKASADEMTEWIQEWHERGCPTKKDEAERREKSLKPERQKMYNLTYARRKNEKAG